MSIGYISTKCPLCGTELRVHTGRKDKKIRFWCVKCGYEELQEPGQGNEDYEINWAQYDHYPGGGSPNP